MVIIIIIIQYFYGISFCPCKNCFLYQRPNIYYKFSWVSLGKWQVSGDSCSQWGESDTANIQFLFGVPSGYVKIAIENDPVEIVDFPIQNGDFPISFLYVYQAG